LRHSSRVVACDVENASHTSAPATSTNDAARNLGSTTVELRLARDLSEQDEPRLAIARVTAIEAARAASRYRVRGASARLLR
jgi:hypothetical protein